MIKMAMVIIYNASMLYIGPLAYAKKDQSLNLKLGTLEGLQGILSISHSVSNTPLILQTLLIFNLTLKRSNHIKLMGDHMANETGSFCLPNARMCVSFSTLASLNAERGGITKQLMASVHRMATVVHRMARRPRHWRLVKARAPGNHCFLRCLP